MLTTEDIQKLKYVFIPGLNGSLDKKFDEKLKPIKEDMAKIRKDVNGIINVFDNEHIDLRTQKSIYTCPFSSKALDFGDLKEGWLSVGHTLPIAPLRMVRPFKEFAC